MTETEMEQVENIAGNAYTGMMVGDNHFSIIPEFASDRLKGDAKVVAMLFAVMDDGIESVDSLVEQGLPVEIANTIGLVGRFFKACLAEPGLLATFEEDLMADDLAMEVSAEIAVSYLAWDVTQTPEQRRLMSVVIVLTTLSHSDQELLSNQFGGGIAG
jgi:hypothetical protein